MKIYKQSLFIFVLISTIKCVYNERIELRCDEFSADNILYEGLYCTVTDIHLIHNDTFNCDVYPYHRHLVKMVKFSNCRIGLVPFMIFQYFEFIREFDMSSTELDSLRHDDFFKADNLMYLTVSHNNLVELTVSLFIGAPNISVVDFSYNHIGKIHSHAFAGSTMLSRLHLSHNLLTHLDKETFNGLSSLDELWLDNNQIEIIDPILFEHNDVLARLSLNNNKIKQIDCQLLKRLNYLIRIDVSANKLQEFDTNCVHGSHYDLIIHDNQLKILTIQRHTMVHAARNFIEQIIIGEDVNNLKLLKLANNTLTNITGIFDHLYSLQTLDLSFNYVGKLNISTFAKLVNLENLHLRSTNLSNINFGTFFHQKELKVLDISYNNLNKINFDVFLPYLKNLESLYIDGNNLTEIEGLTNSLFPQLSALGISNNNFNCTYLAKFLRTLKWEEWALSIDPDLVQSNVTHVNGIACNHLNNETIDNRNTITYNRIIDDGYDHQYNVRKAIIAILKPNKRPNNDNQTTSDSEVEVDDDAGVHGDLDPLRIAHSATEYREHILESHLLTMKYLLAFICLTCLTFVVTKFVIIFRANRQLEFNVAAAAAGCNGIYLQENDKNCIYQSTATMNTLQTNIAY